jgi:hypothetical protein
MCLVLHIVLCKRKPAKCKFQFMMTEDQIQEHRSTYIQQTMVFAISVSLKKTGFYFNTCAQDHSSMTSTNACESQLEVTGPLLLICFLLLILVISIRLHLFLSVVLNCKNIGEKLIYKNVITRFTF